MRTLLILLGLSLAIYGCGSSSHTKDNSDKDIIRIANDSLEYEVLIFEPGFDSWLAMQKPRGYYSQSYLEMKNREYVTIYNSRVRQPNLYPRDVYPETINYDSRTDYGYEVNYLLYNYFIYFQEKYNQHLK